LEGSQPEYSGQQEKVYYFKGHGMHYTSFLSTDLDKQHAAEILQTGLRHS